MSPSDDERKKKHLTATFVATQFHCRNLTHTQKKIERKKLNFVLSFHLVIMALIEKHFLSLH